MTNFSSIIIETYSSITVELRKLLHNHAKWERNDKHEKLFNVLTVKSHFMLNCFHPKLNTGVICDASPYGLSAILTQYCEDKNKKRMVAYATRSMTKKEQRYSQIEREALAMLFSYTKVYLLEKDFKLMTP